MTATILIPTYENLPLLRALLRSICPLGSKIKAAIYDDSRSDLIFNELPKLSKNVPFSLDYSRIKDGCDHKNRAAANWNRAINNTTISIGDIYQIRHHDDHFVQLSYGFCSSLEAFEDSPYTIMLTPTIKLLFQWRSFRLYRYHCPPLILRILLAMPPELLYYYNYIGPTASVWLKKSSDSVPLFDTSLTWLVDVDWYSRLLRRSGSDDVHINVKGSTLSAHNQHSITASLHSVAQMQRSESDICLSQHTSSTRLRLLIIAQTFKVISLISSLATPICCRHDYKPFSP